MTQRGQERRRPFINVMKITVLDVYENLVGLSISLKEGRKRVLQRTVERGSDRGQKVVTKLQSKDHVRRYS